MQKFDQNTNNITKNNDCLTIYTNSSMILGTIMIQRNKCLKIDVVDVFSDLEKRLIKTFITIVN